MREIKFRAWDKQRKAMYRVSKITWDELGMKWWKWSGIELEQDCPLMQFTGLHDKNGKEIYEGDIVKQHLYHTNESWYQVEIIFNRGRFCLNTGTIPEDLMPELSEVIGNIYENSDLLSAPKQNHE